MLHRGACIGSENVGLGMFYVSKVCIKMTACEEAVIRFLLRVQKEEISYHSATKYVILQR